MADASPDPMARLMPTRRSDNGPAPAEAASLFVGPVMHQRMKPSENRFSYQVFSLLVDLDRLEDADRLSPLFSVGRFNLVSFHPRDHGPRDGSDLRCHADRLLAEAGVARPERILLLAYPRVAGQVFNPLAVYFAYDAEGDLSAVLYEVRNTFGGLHTYVAPVRPGQMSDAGLRQDQEKLFHVSPFLDMDQHYHFRLLPPGQAVRLRILERDPQGPILSATFHGTQRPLTSATLLSLCARIPLLGIKVLGAIHWQAFKIWRMGVPFHKTPPPGSAKGRPVPEREHSRAA